VPTGTALGAVGAAGQPTAAQVAAPMVSMDHERYVSRFDLLYDRLMREPRFILEIDDILATFGTFMAVLIAIEIFVNIVLYLRHDVIHVKLVIATALMAIARKVIILDFAETSAMEALALGVVLVATALAYWIVYRYTPPADQDETHHL
jgi:uncharacterized membrane protein (DUF373 family)